MIKILVGFSRKTSTRIRCGSLGFFNFVGHLQKQTATNEIADFSFDLLGQNVGSFTETAKTLASECLRASSRAFKRFSTVETKEVSWSFRIASSRAFERLDFSRFFTEN